jgi:hypothetical protein
MRELGVLPDFLDYHRYEYAPRQESDYVLLQAARTWKGDLESFRQMLADYAGPGGETIEILSTENNSVSTNPGKQTTSLVNALYMADAFGQALLTEVRSFVWFDLRNGTTQFNNGEELYGWRMYGDYGALSHTNERYPAAYAMVLLGEFAAPGDTVIESTTSWPLVSAYAVKRREDQIRLLLVNKSANDRFPTSIALPGMAITGRVVRASYGLANDDAARTGAGSPDITRGELEGSGNAITTNLEPYSITVLTIPIKPPPARRRTIRR